MTWRLCEPEHQYAWYWHRCQVTRQWFTLKCGPRIIPGSVDKTVQWFTLKLSYSTMGSILTVTFQSVCLISTLFVSVIFWIPVPGARTCLSRMLSQWKCRVFHSSSPRKPFYRVHCVAKRNIINSHKPNFHKGEDNLLKFPIMHQS